MKKSYFNRMFVGIVVFLLSWVFGFSSPATGTTLTGLIEYASSSSGGGIGGNAWQTLGGDSAPNLYVRSGDIASGGSLGPFLNSGNGPGASISIPLVAGANTFTFFGNTALVENFAAQYALNLFFNGNNNTPGISVFAPVDAPPSPPFPAFVANLSNLTINLATTAFVPGAGTLIFPDGTTTVTLTDYSWSQPAVFNTNQVNDDDIIPGGGNDFVGRLTLTVSGPAGVIPEPSTWLLLGSGLAGLVIWRRYANA